MSLKYNTVKVFVRLKQSVVGFPKNDFVVILARQGFGDFSKKVKLEEKNFVAIEKHLNLSSLQKTLKRKYYEQS
jgi:hypothetical protein